MKKFLCACLLFFLCANSTLLYANMPDLSLLRQLTNASGAPGFEDNIHDLMIKHWSALLKPIQTDGMGNIIGVLQASPNHPRILLMAHMDEVAFMVRDITDDGFIHIQALGGFADNVLVAQRWQIQTKQGPVLGYSGMETPHLLPLKDKETLVNKKDIFLDIGASSREEVEKAYHIRPGLPVTPDSQFTYLNKHRVLAKALDDRVGLAVITQILKNLQDKKLSHSVYAAASVQEEMGLRGSQVIYETAKPDLVINLEVGMASDFPMLQAKQSSNIKLGQGPTIFIYDRDMIPNAHLVQKVIDIANKNQIPIQFESEVRYGEDGASLQRSGHGVPAINIGIPTRYTHQQAGVMDTKDYQETVKLVTLLVEQL